jgi:hypothetical protein
VVSTSGTYGRISIKLWENIYGAESTSASGEVRILMKNHMNFYKAAGGMVLSCSILTALTGTGLYGTVVWADASREAAIPPYRIEIRCAEKVLELWAGADLLRVYPISTGKGGIGKTRSGDHKTPLGDYEISWMASKKSAKGHRIVNGTSWCANNKFYYGPDGPPLERLWADVYGGEDATVLSINYPNASDRANGRTGDCIHIHAEKKIAEGSLRESYGCIHLYTEHARELYEIVDVCTPVKILP